VSHNVFAVAVHAIEFAMVDEVEFELLKADLFDFSIVFHLVLEDVAELYEFLDRIGADIVLLVLLLLIFDLFNGIYQTVLSFPLELWEEFPAADFGALRLYTGT
jgi:hypothetical protein